MKLYARQQGQGQNIVSLHGLFGSQENLGMINRGLAEQFCVHGLDVRNHGRSPHDPEMNYEAMAADVLEYLDDQNLNQVYLLGHSMGGKIAMTLALNAPERVKKLAVIDIAPVTYTVRRHDDILAGLESLDLRTLTKRSEADMHLKSFIAEKDVRQFLLKNLYKTENGEYRYRMNLQSIHEHYPEIQAGQFSERSFNGESIFIKGGDSDYILPEHRASVLKLFPGAKVRVVNGAGHWVHAQKPDVVTKTLLRFFAA